MSMLLALALQPVIAEPAAKQQEIVVIGQKLKTWRGVIKTRKGIPTCKTRKSSGDKAIDAIGCDAMMACWLPQQDNLSNLKMTSLNKAEFDSLSKPIFEKIGTCLVEKREDGIAALASRRAASK
jgi:hypothetical protein